MEYASWTVLWIAVLGVGMAGALAGCAHLIPTGRVVDEERFLGEDEAPAVSQGEPRVSFPVLPFSVWGLHFDEELVLELADHPTWRMLEVVRVEIAGESLWFSLDSHRCGRQWVATDERSEAVAAGFPAPTYRTDLEVDRFRDAGEIRYRASWTMRTGEKIEVNARARRPLWTPPMRNGNTMNHSQETALALIDLEKLRPAVGTVRIDGVEQRTVVLSRGLLVQAAGGLMEDSRELEADGERLIARRAPGQEVIYERESVEGGFVLVARTPTAVESWRFAERGAGQHLEQVQIEQEGHEVLKLRFNPALVDLRRPVAGESRSRMAASVNGRAGYMAADVTVGPGDDADSVEVRVEPRAPRWAAARPARATLRFTDDPSLIVETAIEPTNPWSFGEVDCPE